MIDWKDPKSKVSKYFTVKECLWLPQWNRMANEEDGLTDEIKQNIIQLCYQMDVVREYLNSPINVHCFYRPDAYNKLVGGAANSAHKDGMAIDWDTPGINCNELRPKLVDKLEEWCLRCEDHQGNWIHLDSRSVGPSGRFFPV